MKVSKGFASKVVEVEKDHVLEMPEISKLRKMAIREIDKGDRLDSTRNYQRGFAALDGTPKNKAAATFLETVRTEFKNRVKGERAGEKLRAFFAVHADRLPADLAEHLDLGAKDAFRVSATGGQGTGHRDLALSVPLKDSVPDGFATRFMAFLSAQPELASVAKQLKSSQWGGVDLWVRASLDPNALGWSTENATHAFEQAQSPGSRGGEQIAMNELGDIIQALANVGIIGAGPKDTPEWAAQKKDFVEAFKKADAAGHVDAAARADFEEIRELYHLPK
jgi:hypothetical protein